MNAGDIMTRPAITVTPQTTIAEAARLMVNERVSGLPVTDADGAIVGIVTEGDLLHRSETGTAARHSRWLELLVGPGRLARDYVHAHARKVGEIMTTKVVSAEPGTELSEVVKLMEAHRVKRLPIIDGGRLVGILSRANLVAALADSLERAATATGATGATDDGEIRERILEAIQNEPWGPRASVDVTVTDGVVELYGTITDERERVALQVVAENVPGVKAVRDRLVWVEPISGIVIPAEGSEPPETP